MIAAAELTWLAKVVDILGDKSVWNSLSGAGLGAAFYILLKTHKYLVDRSFDPKYDNAYLTRFATGVVAGFILSNITGFLAANAATPNTFTKLSPGVIAMLGGFSAEAVEQILQRMSEVLLTLVRGDGSAQAKADQTTILARMGEEQSKKNVAAREKLADLKNVPSNQLSQAVEDIRSLLK